MSRDMTCAECVDALAEYVAGLGDTRERERIERHLQTCDRCREELDFWQAIGAAVERDVAAIPADTHKVEGWSRLVAQLPVPPSQPSSHSALSASGGQLVRHDYLQTVELEEAFERQPDQPRQPSLANRPARRWRSAVGAVAALIIVALGALLFGSHASRRSTPAPSGSPVVVNAQPGPQLPNGVTMTAVTLAGPGEYWATGDMVNSATGQPHKSVILRFSAGRWAQVGDSLPSSSLSGLDMVSASEGWAWGADMSGGAVILRIGDGAWERVTVSGAERGATPQFIRMSSPNDGWLVMQNSKTANGNITPSTLLHYTNGAWRVVESPLPYYHDIAPIGPDDAWVLGSDTESQLIVHVTSGKSVVAFRLPAMNTDGSIGLDRLRATSPNDIWATGVRYSASPATSPNWQDSSTPALYHYDGISWKSVAPADLRVPMGAQRVQVIPYGGIWATRSATISIFSGRHEPAESRVQAIYQVDKGTWQEVSLPYSDLVGLTIIPDASTAGDVWAIGGYSIYITTPNSSTVSGGTHLVLLHYLNGAWTEYGR